MRKVKAAVLILAFLFLESQEGSALLLDMACGRSYSGTRTDRLVNPWMVSLIVNGEVKCRGSLIKSRFVLTAAHCVFTDEMHVHFGTTFSLDRRNPGEYCRLDPNCVRVDKKIVHSQFNNQTQQNDIAILRMQHAVQYSDIVRPICLLINGTWPAVDRFHSTGWSTTEARYRIIERIDRLNCSSKFNRQVDESQICVRSNACLGDSGSPMSARILHMGRYRTFQLGFIIYGLNSCAGLNVYTNVTYYMDWILNVLDNWWA
ncbi:CLIP domain-containing serine protease B15 [Drosophila santomea]|uniref:CLIP domain-containing serine protease B15 n=1 Tax=Drosophila santomea TaxID=129105 RepID=UPI001952D9A9|nr:CLIP domain-containing serine protease B15 [Drosophila santomea]